MPLVHFNPNTLKASYNSATSKVQVLEKRCMCFAIGQTPRYYTVEITGVLSCEDPSGGDAVNGIWQLTQLESPFGEAEEWCYWKYLDEAVWIEMLYETESSYLMVMGNFWNDSPANWYNAYAYRIIDTADCDDLLSGTDIANQNTECDVPMSILGYDGTASWCRDWHPGGC